METNVIRQSHFGTKDREIFDGQIMKSSAAVPLQEIINTINVENNTLMNVVRPMHIHPAMSEVVLQAFGNLRET
jgi:pyruvate/2-oxoglutarate dehydrogenase complex dihydrolipoamide dehydrogenase (E3) component